MSKRSSGPISLFRRRRLLLRLLRDCRLRRVLLPCHRRRRRRLNQFQFLHLESLRRQEVISRVLPPLASLPERAVNLGCVGSVAKAIVVSAVDGQIQIF